MNFLIIFGAKYFFILVILIALVYFLYLPNEKKKEMAIFTVIALPVIFIFSRIASHFYYDPRPFISENIVPLITHAPDNGFPSDHTLISAAFASIVFFYNKKIGALLFILTIIVGACRVLAGVHHAVDIIGSILIAIIFSWLIYMYILSPVLKKLKLKKD